MVKLNISELQTINEIEDISDKDLESVVGGVGRKIPLVSVKGLLIKKSTYLNRLPV
ncbi:hypothetical protein [Scytonema hofmannii]|uniref:hypothetical protein n=1 Tax=Scytonema hofmannii TaxID=34078 RepID=UPI00034A8AE8|nr:hypothetical protein [Scytonema hofmannii]